VTSALLGHPEDLVDLKDRALAGRAGLRDGRLRALLRPGRVGRGVASPRPPRGLPHGSPGAEPNNARTGSAEGCPRAAVWSGCARSTRCHTAPACKIGDPVTPVRSLARKLLTKNQVRGQQIQSRSEPGPKSRLIYINCYINDYGRPRTSSDRSPRIRAVPGQIAGRGRVLPATTEQKASSPSPARSERHVRELRWAPGLIFGLIRLRSPTSIGVRINAAMQVADINGIRRTIIQTSENRKVAVRPSPWSPPLRGRGGGTRARAPGTRGKLIELLIRPAVNQAGAGNPGDKSDAGHAQKRSDS
jgi:hypothetical protein